MMGDALMGWSTDKGWRVDGASSELEKGAEGARALGLVAPGPALPMRAFLGRFGGPGSLLGRPMGSLPPLPADDRSRGDRTFTYHLGFVSITTTRL